MPLPDQHVYGRAAAHPASPRHPRTAASMPSTAPCLSAPACNVRAHAPWVAPGSVSRASLGRTVRTLRPLRHSVGVPTRRADGVVASRRALGKTAKRMAIVSRGGRHSACQRVLQKALPEARPHRPVPRCPHGVRDGVWASVSSHGRDWQRALRGRHRGWAAARVRAAIYI